MRSKAKGKEKIWDEFILTKREKTLKVRMQTKIYATPADPFPSLGTVLRATLADAGTTGLMRGATYRFVSNAPSGAIMFAVYEAGYRRLERKFYG